MPTKKDMATEDFRTYLGQRVEDLDIQILKHKEGQHQWTLELMACPLSRLLQGMAEQHFDHSQTSNMLAAMISELSDARAMLIKCVEKHLYDYGNDV